MPVSFPIVLQITMVTPSLPAAHNGNGVTVARWAQRLRELGHRVRIVSRQNSRRSRAGSSGDLSGDLLIALHASKTAAAALRFARSGRPFVTALTGTDLYRDLRRSARAQEVLRRSSALVLLQPLGLESLPQGVRRKVHVILQSAQAPRRRRRAGADGRFDVAVLGHMRAVKDPLRAALAARRLPSESRLRIVHAGRALTDSFARRARREMQRNRRYRWLGDLSHASALRLLARSQGLVLSSRLEGGANVLSEAAVAHVPVLASRIPGSLGLLGYDYPGYFEVGDTDGLATLLQRLESDAAFRADLRRRLRRLAPRFSPARERAAWRALLSQVLGPAAASPRRTHRSGTP